MISAVMFDLDGTLLPFVQDEFVKLYFKGLCKKLAPLGYDPDKLVKVVWKGTEAMIRNDGSQKNCAAFWEVFHTAFPGMPDAEPLCDDFYTKEFDEVKGCLKFTPNHKPVIERLKAAGLNVILATNPIFPMCAQETRMSWCGLSGSDFSYVTSYENSSYCKPNPKYFTELLGKIGIEPRECVMIGNSVREDILSVEKLDIKSFFVDEFAENPEGLDVSGFKKGSIEDAEKFVMSLL